MKYKETSTKALRIYPSKKEVLITEYTNNGMVIVECETISGTVDVRITWHPKSKEWIVEQLQRSNKQRTLLERKEIIPPINPSRRSNSEGDFK